MTARLYVTPKTTEQNLIVHTGKSEAEVTNKRLCSSAYGALQICLWLWLW